MNKIISIVFVLCGLVFEEGNYKNIKGFPVYPESKFSGMSEFISNGKKIEVCTFKSPDSVNAIKNYLVKSLSRNGWNLSSNSPNLLSFSKGNLVMKVQIAHPREGKTTQIIFYKDIGIKISDVPDNLSDIPLYPTSKRLFNIKRLTGSPHSDTLIYETNDSVDSVISFYKNNMRNWGNVKFSGYSNEKMLYFNSIKFWCIITASKQREKTIFTIIRYNK